MLRRLPLLLLLVPAVARADSEDDSDSKLPPLSVYGFARLDVLADDAKLSDVAQPMFVQHMAVGQQNEGEMTMTPRLSRVGLSIDDWDVNGMDFVKGEGKLEVDFAGGGGTNAIRLRQAYAQVTFDEHLRLLAGQTDDLFSPLIPTAQNDTQLEFAGNVGDRRPQLRMVLENDLLRGGVALATTTTTSPTASARPMFEWLLEVHKLVRHIGTIKFGVSGHVASEEEPDGTRRGTSSVGMHAFVPILPMIAMQGEVYFGENAAEIGGGIDQGIDPMTNHRIGARGGWAELVTAPTKKHVVAVGTSIDTANSEDLQSGDRQSNSTVYAVVRYKPMPTIQLAAEYLFWKTIYRDMSGSATANRVDLHLSVFF